MAGPIVSRERIRAELDRINGQDYGFSSDEVMVLVSANLMVPVESVREVANDMAKEQV